MTQQKVDRASENASLPWPARFRWPLAFLAALLLAGATWWIGGTGEDPYDRENTKQTAMPEPGEILREVLARRDERVVVSEELADTVAPADLEAAQALLATAQAPTWIFLIPEADPMDGSYTEHGAAEVLGHEVLGGDPGYVVTLFPDGQSVVSEQGDVSGEYLDSTGRSGPAMVRMAETMASWSTEPEDD